jgi:ankyrin repeat protein
LTPLSKGDINRKDHAGLTLLLRASSSRLESARGFVRALLDHPAINIYVQDMESGWNALHRALYAGNMSIAQLLLEKERVALAGRAGGSSPQGDASRIQPLIKTKDHEGHSPFDLYRATITNCPSNIVPGSEQASDSDSDDSATDVGVK